MTRSADIHLPVRETSSSGSRAACLCFVAPTLSADFTPFFLSLLVGCLILKRDLRSSGSTYPLDLGLPPLSTYFSQLIFGPHSRAFVQILLRERSSTSVFETNAKQMNLMSPSSLPLDFLRSVLQVGGTTGPWSVCHRSEEFADGQGVVGTGGRQSLESVEG